MMKAHIGCLFDALVIFRIGSLEKWLGPLGALSKDVRNGTVSEGDHDEQHGNCHSNRFRIVAEESLDVHVCSRR